MSSNIDIFAQTSYGKAALRKLGKVPENFGYPDFGVE